MYERGKGSGDRGTTKGTAEPPEGQIARPSIHLPGELRFGHQGLWSQPLVRASVIGYEICTGHHSGCQGPPEVRRGRRVRGRKNKPNQIYVWPPRETDLTNDTEAYHSASSPNTTTRSRLYHCGSAEFLAKNQISYVYNTYYVYYIPYHICHR